MKNKYTKEWLKAALIRAVKTAAQVILSMITVGKALDEFDWVKIASVGVVAFLYSIITSLAGLPEVKNGEDGTLLIDTTDPEVNRYLLQYNSDLEEIAGKKSVTFKVNPNADLSDTDHE